MAENKEHILAVRDLDITFKTTAGPVHASRGVNIDLYRGETVALAGEQEEILTADCDLQILTDIRSSIPVFRDRRPQLYNI